MSELAGAEHFGGEIREAAQAKAERITREALRKLGWREDELSRRCKGDAAKIRIALHLRTETTMTLDWIAHRLRMGAKTHLLFWRGEDGKNAS